MSVRRAALEDIPRILPCARKFCAILKWKLDEDFFVEGLRQLLDQGFGAIFLLESGDEVVGSIGGNLQRDPICNRIIASEIFWFVNPENRANTGSLRLLAMFEQWARDSGAENICMIAMQDSCPEAMDSLYSRLGYRKIQTTYVK